MRHKLLLSAALILVLGSLGAAAHYAGSRPGAPPPPAVSRDGKWRQDVEYFARELPRLHANAFHTLSRERFNEEVQRLLRDIPTLAEDAIRVRLAQLTASIGDGHTELDPVGNSARTLPLSVYWYSDGLFVTRVAPEYSRLAGSELLRIGDVPVTDAFQRVATLISHDNAIRPLGVSPRLLVSPDVLHALGVVPSSDSATILFRLRNGETTTVVLRAAVARGMDRNAWVRAVPNPPLYRKYPDRAFWFAHLDNGHTLYVRYSDCRDPLEFWRFSREVARALHDTAVRKVVVDFRANAGGNSFQFDHMLLNELRNSADRASGRQMYEVTDRSTFSSATANALSMHRETHALLIGEASGMKPNAYGEVRKFVLPNSRLTVWYATKYIETDPALKDAPTLVPDRPIQVSSREYLAGRDPVLEFILEQ